jgi:hypothetical protein
MKRIFKSIGIATVVAAAAVPSALAMHSSDGYAGPVTPNGISVKAAPHDPALGARHEALGQLGVDTSDVFTRYVANHTTTPVPYLSHGVGVDASQFGGTGVEQVSTRPDDKAGVRTSEPTSIVAVASTGSGFDWGDAGIGAGSALGAFLLMGLGVAVSQRNRKGPLAA